MQRLPAEDVVAPDARIAVDLSEVEAPTFDDEELLDDPFLTTDDDFDMMSTNAPSSSFTASTSLADGPLTSDLTTPPLEEISLEDVQVETSGDAGELAADLPLPEGEPDQLLAEATVYLRCGKHDQAISRNLPFKQCG